MVENTKIEWADHTFNPWTGCTKVSAGCKNCYAEAIRDHRLKKGEWGPNGVRKRTSQTYWNDPLRWNKKAKSEGVRKRVFCASMADVFENREELWDWRKDLMELIRATPMLDWLLLTKRPHNIRPMLEDHFDSIPRNIWLGTSVEDQIQADTRIEQLKKCCHLTPVMFLSCEPLLEPIEFSPTLLPLDWVIVGGESGPNARFCGMDWIQGIVNECRSHSVPVFVKQLGSNTDCEQEVGPKGGELEGLDLCIREFPQVNQ